MPRSKRLLTPTAALLLAACGGVDRQSLAGRVRNKLIDVRERCLLRFGKIIQHGASRAERHRVGRVRLGIEPET